MYYYKIQINCDDPLDEDDFIILSSEKEYSQFEFNSIVQDCIDECIDLYCNRDTYNNKEPCWYTVDELLNRFNLPFLLKVNIQYPCPPRLSIVSCLCIVSR